MSVWRERDELQAQNEEMKGVLMKYAIQLALDIKLAGLEKTPDVPLYRQCYLEVCEVIPDLPTSPETLAEQLMKTLGTPLGREYFLDTA